MRLRRKGSTDEVRKNARPTCSMRGCHEPHVALGLCRNHYLQDYGKRARLAAKVADPRTCGFCGKPIDPAKRRRGPVSYCSRVCKDWARVASGQAAIASKRSYFKTRYRLTVEEVEQLANNGCAICGTTVWVGRHARPHIDHDHKTGRVRGLLCTNCNSGLGQFKDDPAILRAAIRYLNR